MRVLLFTGDEPLYLPVYLDPVLEAHADVVEAVVVAPPDAPLREQVGDQLRMFGPRDFLRMGARFARGRLLGAVDRLPGRPAWRLTGRPHSVRTVARARGVPVWDPGDVNDPGFVRRVRAADPDVILSVVCGQKLGADLLDVPEHAINVHGSLLPDYRGRATAFWPLYYGDEESGVTAHLMTDEFDAGPIVRRRSFPVAAGDTMDDLYRKIADAGGDLAVDLLDDLRDDPDREFETEPNETTPDDYHSLPGPAQRREFRRRGNEFL